MTRLKPIAEEQRFLNDQAHASEKRRPCLMSVFYIIVHLEIFVLSLQVRSSDRLHLFVFIALKI